MNVHDLIDLLQTLPPDAFVATKVSCVDDHCDYSDKELAPEYTVGGARYDQGEVVLSLEPCDE